MVRRLDCHPAVVARQRSRMVQDLEYDILVE